jgi:hypothetical protein
MSLAIAETRRTFNHARDGFKLSEERVNVQYALRKYLTFTNLLFDSDLKGQENPDFDELALLEAVFIKDTNGGVEETL